MVHYLDSARRWDKDVRMDEGRRSHTIHQAREGADFEAEVNDSGDWDLENGTFWRQRLQQDGRRDIFCDCFRYM